MAISHLPADDGRKNSSESSCYAYIYCYSYVFTQLYKSLKYIDQICVEVFGKTIRRTEMIDHSFERKLNGAWNGLC